MVCFKRNNRLHCIMHCTYTLTFRNIWTLRSEHFCVPDALYYTFTSHILTPLRTKYMHMYMYFVILLLSHYYIGMCGAVEFNLPFCMYIYMYSTCTYG